MTREEEAKAFSLICHLLSEQQEQFNVMVQGLAACVTRIDKLEQSVKFAKAMAVIAPRPVQIELDE